MASKVAEGYIEMRVDQQRLASDLSQSRGMVQSTFGSISGIASSAASTMTGVLGGLLGAQALNSISAGAHQLAGAMISANAQAETFAVGLQAMTGSAEAGRTMFAQLRQFAMGTPFQLAGLTSATQKLLAFGYGADEVIPILRGVGDVASAMPEGAAQGMQRVIDVLGQMKSTGQVSGREMHSLAIAGIPIWQGLAEVMGTDVASAQKAVTDGTVDARTGMEAMMAVAKDPRFAGMMGKLSQTFEGSMSNLRDLMWQTAADMGGPVFDAAKDAINGLTAYIQSDAGKRLIATFRDIMGSVMNMVRPLGPMLLSVMPVVVRGFEELALTLSDFGGTMELVWTQLALWGVQAMDSLEEAWMQLVAVGYGAGAAIGATFSAVWDNIVAGVQAMSNGVRAYFSGLAAAVLAAFEGEDPLAAFRTSFQRTMDHLSRKSRQYRDIGEASGRAFTEGYESVLKDRRPGSELQDELRKERDALLTRRQRALEQARADRDARNRGEDTGALPGAKTGTPGAKPIEVKITYVGLAEMYKKVQESVAHTGTQELAKRSVIAAEGTRAGVAENVAATLAVRDAVKNINTGLA